MKYYIEYVRKIFLCLSAIIVGIFIFLSSSTAHINYNILSPSFHERLFVKYDIYSGATYLLENSITKYIAYVKEVSPDSYTQQKDVFDVLEQTTSKEAVTRSIDFLREGIYEYMSGQRKFLPDITLKAPADSTTATSPSNNSFSNISKVNLGAVLMYANRNDIVDYLAIIKLVYYFASKLSNLLLPVLLLFFILSFTLLKNFKQLYKWLASIFISMSVLFAVTALTLSIYVYFLLPRSIYPITMTLSMDSKPVLAYIRDCANPLILFEFAIAALSIMLTIVLNRYSRHAKEDPKEIKDVFSDTRLKIYKGIKVSLIVFIVFLLSSSFYVRLGYIVKDSKDNDFASVIYKMRGVETMSEVIPAKDAFIHDVQIKVVDGKTEEPIKGVRLSVTGKNEDNGKEYADSNILDGSGQAKFSLDKGVFKLMFYSPTFPTDKYKLPGPVFFELTTPGTKVLTVNLEAISGSQLKAGFAEVEILDTDNNPLQGVELQVASAIDAAGHPDYVSAVSNSQGIAVFKLNEGNYKVKFTPSKIPVKFSPPQEFTVDVKAEKTSRYTIRMTLK